MMFTIVVAGRNDNYGGQFVERLLRTAGHNSARFLAAGIPFEYLFVEWNPVPDVPLLSETFTRLVPHGRALVVAAEIHDAYSANPAMPFYEMPAKNAGIRRARGEFTIVTNADVLFDDDLIEMIRDKRLDRRTFYRAHRIDVRPELEWPAMKDPANQLASAEGACVPPYYLGAGGDFALASTALWHETTGFNETARFTTRAKDWQFFLSAAAMGIPIQFLGEVYHLDHDGGFRNTARAERDRPTAHFGGLWDYEFGVPAKNRPDWGLAGCEERQDAEHALAVLQSHAPLFTPSQDEEDRRWQEWLTHPSGEADWASAVLAYAVVAAAERQVPLVCRIDRPRTAVALAGVSTVAARAGVQVFCNWEWPTATWMRPRQLPAESASRRPGTVVLTERSGSWRIEADGLDITSAILPSRRPVLDPGFNPLLVRRLLRAWLRIRAAGHRRVAIYGAGGHTEALLTWGFPDQLELMCVVASTPAANEYHGLPLIAASELDARAADAVLLSSVTYEAEMLDVLGRSQPIPVFPLYLDWPPDLWSR